MLQLPRVQNGGTLRGRQDSEVWVAPRVQGMYTFPCGICKVQGKDKRLPSVGTSAASHKGRKVAHQVVQYSQDLPPQARPNLLVAKSRVCVGFVEQTARTLLLVRPVYGPNHGKVPSSAAILGAAGQLYGLRATQRGACMPGCKQSQGKDTNGNLAGVLPSSEE